MSNDNAELKGPDFTLGIAISDLADGTMVTGHANGQPVLIVRQRAEIFAIGATCTHYGGPLGDGLLVADTVRCPWHHACFSLRTGEALRAPALNPVTCWKVEQRDGKVFVIGEADAVPARERPADAVCPTSVVIIGAGAAGNAAAEMLRREGYAGPVTMIGADDSVPYDRPNLSKDYLAGTAPEEWIPLRTPEFYADHKISLVIGHRVASIDVATCQLVLNDGRKVDFGALLLATGADPVRLPPSVPGSERVHYVRTLADSRMLIAAAKDAKSAVVIGASFIGLEVAASLRARGLNVHVVAPEIRPLERILGPGLGDFIRGIHESHGVIFHLEHSAKAMDATSVTLDNGDRIDADVVVAGIGVRPNIDLATAAGLTIDKGVVVNEFLETSVPGIFAAGDIARYPAAYSGENIRVEHWVVAERMGQAAARNILGKREQFTDVPFFWSQHYDTAISYVGHAEKWDAVEITGDVAKGDCTVKYKRGDKTVAVATVGRDLESLTAEHAMELHVS